MKANVPEKDRPESARTRRARPPQNDDEGYHAQLTPDELSRLITALLASADGPDLEEIRKSAPCWRTGPWAGQLPGIGTLAHLRDLYRFQEIAAGNAAGVRILAGVLKNIAISEDQLDAIGHKILTLLALLRFDTKTFLQLRAARDETRFEHRRLALREREAARDDGAHELARLKFQRDTCDLFLRWNENRRAQEIADGPGDNAAKIEALGQIMFGEDWRTDEPLCDPPLNTEN